LNRLRVLILFFLFASTVVAYGGDASGWFSHVAEAAPRQEPISTVIGGVRVTLTRAIFPSDPTDVAVQTATQDQAAALFLILVNEGDETRTFSYRDTRNSIVLIDSAGDGHVDSMNNFSARSTKLNPDWLWYSAQSVRNRDLFIEPGQTVSGWAYFPVPLGRTLAALEVAPAIGVSGQLDLSSFTVEPSPPPATVGAWPTASRPATLVPTPSATPVRPDEGTCDPGESPRYVSGFADLKRQLADWMGEPVTCELADPNGTGDVHQVTTRGLAFWRKATNTPTFTNGTEHWALTQIGLLYWAGDSVDPPPTAGPGTPNPCLAAGSCDPVDGGASTPAP
jgi:hypothetical protein